MTEGTRPCRMAIWAAEGFRIIDAVRHLMRCADQGGRRFLTWSLAGCIVMCALACGSAEEGASEQLAQRAAEPTAIDFAALQSASLVVITLDTTRPDHLTPYAGPDASFETPNLARLASQGVLFEQALATAPVTLPTHASLFTGLDPPNHGVRNNGTHYLSPERTTLAEVLQDEGFKTAAFVSAAVLDRRYGLDQGFSRYDDDLSSGEPKKARLNAERPASQTVQTAHRWLDGLEEDDRFFLWLHFFDPHAPYEPPPPWRERFQDRPYDGEIAAVDAAIGSLLLHRRLAERQKTLLVVVGDHGESLGEHGESTHAMLAYDATLRIPWLMRLPVGGDGLRIGQAVSQIDLFPTLMQLLFLDPPPFTSPIDGVSLRRVIASGTDEALERRTLYAETLVPMVTYGWSPLRTLRRQQIKYIEAPQPEVYDLSRDPDELHNLALGGIPPLASDLAAVLQAEPLVATESANRSLDAEMTAKLRSLGYLGTRSAPHRTERPDPKAVIELHEILEEAQHLFLRQDFTPAMERLHRVLRADPENLVALATLAKTLVAVDQPLKAVELADRALVLDPENTDLLVTRGLIELSQDRPARALQLFDAALALDPRWLDAVIERARTLFRLGRMDEGRVVLDRLLHDEPDNARGLIAEVEWILYPAGEIDRATSQLRHVIEREPSQGEAWRLLGRILESEGQVRDAVEVYQQALTQHGNDGFLRGRLGALLVRLGEVADGERQLRLALDKGQDRSPAVLYAMATVARQRSDWPDVERWSRQALEISPSMSSAWNLLAASLEEQARFDDALEAYSEAIREDPGNWQALYNHALLLSRQQRFAEARDLFERVLLLEPDHGPTHFQLGMIYAVALGDDAKARYHLEASLRMEENAATAARIRQVLERLP